MTKLKKPVTFETTFGIYTIDEQLGEGGAGRVYGGVGADGTPVAVKVLAEDRASADKRRRFKNEIAFLARNKHRNIVTVTDHGVARGGPIEGLFYVMQRYQRSLRQLMRDRISPEKVLPLFSQILDGVEAAHMQKRSSSRSQTGERVVRPGFRNPINCGFRNSTIHRGYSRNTG